MIIIIDYWVIVVVGGAVFGNLTKIFAQFKRNGQALVVRLLWKVQKHQRAMQEAVRSMLEGVKGKMILRRKKQEQI